MAELHIIGQIQCGKNFGRTGVFCKWKLDYGGFEDIIIVLLLFMHASGWQRRNCISFWIWRSYLGSGWKKLEGTKSGQTQVDTPLDEELAQWCHPLDIHFVSKGLHGWPKLVIEVRRQDEYGRSDLAGYGTCHIPPTPGLHILEVPTWRPAGAVEIENVLHCLVFHMAIFIHLVCAYVGSLKDEIVRYFIGGAAELTETEFVVNSPERYRLRTVPSGTVIVDINIIHRNFDKFGVEI